MAVKKSIDPALEQNGRLVGRRRNHTSDQSLGLRLQHPGALRKQKCEPADKAVELRPVFRRILDHRRRHGDLRRRIAYLLAGTVEARQGGIAAVDQHRVMKKLLCEIQIAETRLTLAVETILIGADESIGPHHPIEHRSIHSELAGQPLHGAVTVHTAVEIADIAGSEAHAVTAGGEGQIVALRAAV